MTTTVSFPGLGLEFELNRVAFSIGDFPVYWYGIIIGLGLVLALVYAMRKSRHFGIDNDRMLDVVLLGAVAGVVGARIYYVIFAWDEFHSFWDIIDVRKGGLAFYGAVIGAALVAYFVTKRNKLKFWPMLDLAGIGFMIGQGVGRWGNFVNQEAFGVNTTLPWGMTSSVVQSYLRANAAVLEQQGMVIDPMLPVHPTFLYESLWLGLGVLLFTIYIKHRKFDGEMFLMYLAWNGLGRVWIEGLRTDSLYIGRLRVSQLLAGLMVVVAVALIIYFRRKIKRSGDPEYMKPYGMTEQSKTDLAEYAELLKRREQERKDKRGKKTDKTGDDSAAKTDAVVKGTEAENSAADKPAKTTKTKAAGQAAETSKPKPGKKAADTKDSATVKNTAETVEVETEKKPAKSTKAKNAKSGQAANDAAAVETPAEEAEEIVADKSKTTAAKKKPAAKKPADSNDVAAAEKAPAKKPAAKRTAKPDIAEEKPAETKPAKKPAKPKATPKGAAAADGGEKAEDAKPAAKKKTAKKPAAKPEVTPAEQEPTAEQTEE